MVKLVPQKRLRRPLQVRAGNKGRWLARDRCLGAQKQRDRTFLGSAMNILLATSANSSQDSINIVTDGGGTNREESCFGEYKRKVGTDKRANK